MGCGRAPRFTDKDHVLNFIGENPDANGIEIRDSVAPDLPMSTFYDTLKRMKISYKKKEPKYKERKDTQRDEYLQQIEALDKSAFIYLDEMGVDENTTPDRGWAPVGKKTYTQIVGGKKERVSIVAGYCLGTKSTIAEFEYSGTMTKDLFTGWFEQILIPKLIPGKVIIMDNASVHKSMELFDLAHSAGCNVLFLPSYSPDLNPIETFWANLKKAIKAVIRKSGSFKEAITAGFLRTLSG